MVRLPLVLRKTPGEQERCGALGMHWAAGATPWWADGPGSAPGYTHLLDILVFWTYRARDGSTEIFQ